jgi:hypothetical protein
LTIAVEIADVSDGKGKFGEAYRVVLTLKIGCGRLSGRQYLRLLETMVR